MKKPHRFRSLTGSQKLANNLSVEEGRHLLQVEGGPITIGRAAQRLVIALVIAVFTARAIVLGHATAVHLFLPMLAEYLAVLVAVPLIQLKLKHPAIRKDSRGGVILLLFFAAAAAVYIAVQASRQGHPWVEQAAIETVFVRDWIVGHQMHWPMLGAAVGVLLALPGRVQMLYKYGPPFFAVGLGCGMRIAILVLGCFLVPWLIGSSTRLTWALWALLLLAEIGAVWMHWDIQQRLKKAGIQI